MIYIILVLLLLVLVVLGDEWSIPMPSKSSFQGFDAPSSQEKWSRAQQEARQGSQILLRKVQETIKSPSDYIDGDKNFRWLHRMADIFVDKKRGFEQLNDYNGYRVPIVMIGHKEFQFKSFEGDVIGAKTMGIDDLLNRINKGLLKFPKKFIAVGNMDENWGWASSCFMNRTASWGFSYDQSLGPMKSNHNKELLSFLDDPNLIMLVINQHHNITHPKVLTLPRGVFLLNAKYIWDTSLKVLRTGIKKQRLVTSGSSAWGPRPEILSCVKHQLGQDLFISTARLSKYKFMEMAASSYATLAIPGLGYDTFRLWESLTLGTMPILEKGVGFDRLLHKLPALLVEDFAEVTPEIVRQAYIECLYRADEWEYKRLTQRFWVRLLYKVSESGDATLMTKLFPMSAVDDTFVRPMIPFDCSNGCGKGTKRPPKHSCAINPSLNWTEYNYYWDQNRYWPEGDWYPGAIRRPHFQHEE